MGELTLQAARRIDPRRVALALGAIWAVFTLAGLIVDHGWGAWTLQTFSLADSDLDRQLSMPASFTALLLAASAGMAFALSRVDRTRREKQWRLAGWALLLFGVEELFGVHAWLEDRGLHWALAYLPLLALGTLVLLNSLRLFRSEPKTQAVFGLATVLWLAGGALDNPNLVAADTASEILEMAGAVLFAVSLLERLRYLARQYYPLEEAHTRLSLDQITAEALDRLRVRPVAAVLGLVTAAFAIQYVALHTGDYDHAERIRILDLNNEQTLWATFQGTLIFTVAALAILTSRLRATRDDMRIWWLALGGVLLVLGADEIVAVHDRFQDATGAPGQTVLLPVAAVGVLAWWKVLNAIWDVEPARKLFIAGAVLWFLSQLIDVTIQHGMRWTITPEEVGETLGSTLWIFALVRWLRAVLPVGLMPPQPGLPSVTAGRPLIAPLEDPDPRARASTG